MEEAGAEIKHLVKDFMTTDVVAVDENAPIEHLVKLVIEKKFNAYPVVRGRKLIGIVSKMDLIKMYSLGNLSKMDSVKDMMRRAVVTVSPKDPLKYAANLMSEYRIRSLPVTDDESNLMGILSVGDVLKAFVTQLKR